MEKMKETKEERHVHKEEVIDEDKQSNEEERVEGKDQVKQDNKQEHAIKTYVNKSHGTDDFSCTECGKQFKH